MFGSSQWMYSSGGGFYDHEIDGSLRFNEPDSAYLNRTPSGSGNRDTWTWSGWVKRCKFGDQQKIFSAGTSGTDFVSFEFTSGDQFQMYGYFSSATRVYLTSTAKYRDPSAWYHIVVRFDTTQATASNRVRIYINGEQITAFDNSTYPSQNLDFPINNTVQHRLGLGESGNGDYLAGYMAEINHVDGQSLDASSFGETKSGVWIPKAYAGSYGTNGFHLEFAGNANDSSGNGNNFTANNISSYDYVPDSPTLNFCTINPLSAISPVNLQQGNLQYSTNGGAASWYAGSMAMSSGKWYFEYRLRSGNVDVQGGIVALPATPINSNSFDSWRYKTNGNLEYAGGYQASWATSYTTGDVIGIAVDVDGGTFKAYKNGTLVGTKTGISTSATWIPYFVGYNIPVVNVNFGQDSTFAGATTAGGNSDANGYGDFKYSVPSGYLALSTGNLTVAEAVDPAEDNSPQDYFNTVLYTGNASTRSITGVGFQPDLVWGKKRVDADGFHSLFDVIRGPQKVIFTNSTNAEATETLSLTSFDSDGWTMGSWGGLNENTKAIVAWNWKAGGSGVSNSDGSITSTVSASTDAGFSIVSYTGNATSGATVGHGLGVVPEMIILKDRDGTDHWRVYTSTTGATQTLYLSLGNAAATDSTIWNNTAPTSSVFTIGNDSGVNTNTNDYIAYVFSSVEGFSKFGSYTGNGSNDGPFVYTGFRPAFVIFKRYDSGDRWIMSDNERGPYNFIDEFLTANASDAESNYNITGGVDYVSNGFKWRHSDSSINASGGNYIYMAFAENPFKYANAR